MRSTHLSALIVCVGLLASRNVIAQAPCATLSTGHTDLGLAFSTNNNTWSLHVGADDHGSEFAPDEVLLLVKSVAQTTIPASTNFAFLGEASAPVWILPQTEREDLLFLGFGGEELPQNIFTNDQASVTLKNVTGPGDLIAYQVDGFGKGTVYFNTRDGVADQSDRLTVQAGGEVHLNWAFTAPGEYTVVVEASGRLAATGQPTSSGPVAFHFKVLRPPVQLSRDHADLRVLYQTNEAGACLQLVARDSDRAAVYLAEEAVLAVNESAKFTLPGGTPFGNAGDTIWILPQTQDANLLYLGVSAEGIPAGIFAGNFTVRLKDVLGPGHFFVWQATQFGSLNIKMNSADGITDADATTPIVGSHEHFNWGFSTSGVYRVTFQISAQRISDGANLVSPETTFTFHVLPLPVTATRIELRNPKSFPNGGFTFEVVGAANSLIEVQASETFAQWSVVTNFLSTVSPQSVGIPSDTNKPFRFFRTLKR